METASERPPTLPRWTNTAMRTAVVLVPAGFVGFPLLLMAWVRSPLITGLGLVVFQPLQFDHRHHVQDQGIPCTYCHDEAYRSRTAGYPATEVCTGCHAQVWRHTDRLAPVRLSRLAEQPLLWIRVLDLPDFVYFDHQPHTMIGIACSECHGQVEAMPTVVRARAFTMRDCLTCHRDSEAAPIHCSGCHR